MSTDSEELQIVPRQRVRETRYREMKSGNIFLSLPKPKRRRKPQHIPKRQVDSSFVCVVDNEEKFEHLTDAQLQNQVQAMQACRSGPDYEFCNKLKLVTQQNQNSSPFLRLPLEIRLQIYGYLAPPAQVIEVRLYGERRRYEKRNGLTYEKYTKGGLEYQKPLLVTPLWRVCRQIYQEIPFDMYGNCIFEFIHPRWDFKFVDNTLSSSQIKSIKHIGLLSYHDFQHVSTNSLKRFHGLETITIFERDSSEIRTPHEKATSAAKIRQDLGQNIRLVFQKTWGNRQVRVD